MIRVFQTLQNEYPGELLVYMDDILIATKNDIVHVTDKSVLKSLGNHEKRIVFPPSLQM